MANSPIMNAAVLWVWLGTMRVGSGGLCECAVGSGTGICADELAEIVGCVRRKVVSQQATGTPRRVQAVL